VVAVDAVLHVDGQGSPRSLAIPLKRGMELLKTLTVP